MADRKKRVGQWIKCPPNRNKGLEEWFPTLWGSQARVGGVITNMEY